jgi:hypothetical protein
MTARHDVTPTTLQHIEDTASHREVIEKDARGGLGGRDHNKFSR